MKITQKYYLIIDLEATCCDQKSVRRQEMEIIEIGAVMLNSKTLEIEGEFQAFIKPVRHPKLTAFCTELTSITQAQVDSAQGFPEVIAKMKEWMQSYDDYLFCSWGYYDKNQFIQDCKYHKIPYPFPEDHKNLKVAFTAAMQEKKKYGLGGAVRKLGLQFDGTAHRGIDDAKNIARVVQAVLKKDVS